MKNSSSDDAKPQVDKFRDLARDLECDEDEERFEGVMRRITKKPPPDDKSDDGSLDG